MKVYKKGYKAFDKGMICKGKQYAENTVFEEDKAEICSVGMHFCDNKNPLEVLEYYPFIDNDGNMSEFAEVEALDEIKTDDNKKFVTKKLKINNKVSFSELVQASVDFEYTKLTKMDIQQNDSDSAKIGSSGDSAQIGSSGKNSVICCAGHNSVVKAKKGSWITLSEWELVDNKWIPKCVKTEYVDGIKIKEDTFYKLINGVFVEQEE